MKTSNSYHSLGNNRHDIGVFWTNVHISKLVHLSFDSGQLLQENHLNYDLNDPISSLATGSIIDKKGLLETMIICFDVEFVYVVPASNVICFMQFDRFNRPNPLMQ